MVSENNPGTNLIVTKMKNLDSIPHIVNGIFRELNRASNISITLTASISNQLPETNKPASVSLRGSRIYGIRSSGKPGFSIDQVNSCPTPEEFYHSLLNLCAGVRLATVDALQTLDPSEKGTLLLEAFHRVSILLAAHPFAHRYFVALRILSIQLICLLTVVEHHNDLCPPRSTAQTESRDKLRFTGSVPCLAALGRILASRNLFEAPNKSQFFRTVATMFSTSQQPDISWLSFRNHFNSPSPEALAFWDAELSEWRRFIRKLSVLN